MLRVLEPGALSTVQDGGRPASAHLGVPRSGACDDWSMGVANRLLGNEPDAAVLEMTMLGATFEVVASGVIAIAGADMEAQVIEEGRSLDRSASHLVRAGTTLRFGPAVRGVRAYLALPGGIAVDPVLGSRSTCLAGGFGGLDGRALAPGDSLVPSRPPTDATAARSWPAGGFDPPLEGIARVVVVADPPGVLPEALDGLVGREWFVSPVGDRTGVRLDGEPLPTSEVAAELVSSGVVPGVIQVPPSGLPIVLLADAPTVGGYPVLAVVARADLPVVAQRQPGEALSFRIVDAQTAREASAARYARLAPGSMDRGEGV